MSEDLKEGVITTDFEYYHSCEMGEQISYMLYDPKGDMILNKVCSADSQIKIKVNNPELWWPRSHGEQPLYQLKVVLHRNDTVLDTRIKQIGFRRLDYKKNFEFYINHLPLRLWGANLTQVDTVSGCYHEEKMNHLLDLMEYANCNIVRIWGESEVLDDRFYEQCDQRGLLIWQDFYIGYNMYNVEPDMMKLYEKEAVWLVTRLKHHPSIVLLCGGN